MIDSRKVGQGLYAQHLNGRLNRTSVLLQLGFSTESDIQIYFENRPLVDHVLYEFPTGSLLVLVPVDVAPATLGSLQSMLADPTCWDPSDPCLHTEVGTDFLLLSDGGQRTVNIDLDTTDSSIEFKRTAATVFQYDVAKVTVCPSVPRIRDCACFGKVCMAIIVATEQISRIPIPPGRPLPMRHIALLDRRPLLKDVSWVIAIRGVLNLDLLLREYQDTAPFGHSVSLTGGQHEPRETRTLLKVQHGEVLTLQYVEDPPAPLGMHSGRSDEPTEGEDSDSTQSDDPSSRGDSILRSPTTPAQAPENTDDRSRTPP